jgi:DNA gyrase/topoisomerase IV subunit A
MRRFEAILMAHTDMDAVFQIFKNAKKPEDTIQPLIERFGMTQFQAKYLSEITLGSITNINVEKLKLDLERIHTESVEVQKKMFMIDAVICEAAENIRKKFGGEFGHRRSAVPSFIGCATIGQGRIQFNSLTEADMIISRFGIDTDIRLYPNGVKNKVRHHDDGLDDESELSFPKEFVTKHFQVSNRKHKFTVGIRKNPTTIFAVKGLHYRDEPDVKYVHVSEQFLTIDKDGCLKILTPNDLAVRKSADSTGILSDIENVYPIVSNEVYIAYINSNEKNVVRVVKLETSGRLRRSPLGETTILTVWKPGEDSIISVPESHLNRISIAHVLIHSSETAGSIIIDLSKRSSSDGRSLSKYGTHLMHLK